MTDHTYHVPHAQGIFGPLHCLTDLVLVGNQVERAPDEVLLRAYNLLSEFPVERFANRIEAVRRTVLMLTYREMQLRYTWAAGEHRWTLRRCTGFVDAVSRHRWSRPMISRHGWREGKRGRRITEQRWRRRCAESVVWCDVSHCRVELLVEQCTLPEFSRPGYRVLWSVLATGVTLAECLVVAGRLGAPRYSLSHDELLRMLVAVQGAGEAVIWTEDEVWWEERHGEQVPEWLRPAR